MTPPQFKKYQDTWAKELSDKKAREEQNKLN